MGPPYDSVKFEPSQAFSVTFAVISEASALQLIDLGSVHPHHCRLLCSHDGMRTMEVEC